MSKVDKKIHAETVTAGFAILAFAFLFVMTATEGKYWGSNEMDEYIIKITEGEEQSYLDSKTPTAMVINKLSGSDPFLKRDCQARGTCLEQDVCTVAEQGYVMSHGRMVARVTYMSCELAKEEIDRNDPSEQAYATQDDPHQEVLNFSPFVYLPYYCLNRLTDLKNPYSFIIYFIWKQRVQKRTNLKK